MKKQDEDLWLKKVKEALDEYSETPPPGVWERLEKELTPPVLVEKRIYSFRTWASVAAVLLLAVSAISIYFLQTPTADEIRQTSTSVVAVAPDIIPDIKAPERITPKVEYVRTAKVQPKETRQPVVGESIIEVMEEVIQEESNVQETLSPAADETAAVVEEATAQNNKGEERKIIRPSGKDKLHLPVETKKSKSVDKNWSVGLSMNSSAVFSKSGSLVYANNMTDKVELGQSHSTGIISIPDNGTVYFYNGVAYVVNEELQVVDWKHRQPISFGLSVRKGLANNFSIETGLTYTLLSSEAKFHGNNAKKVEQKLHYIGIPVRANWDFIDSRRFTLYLAAGGMAEKCVYGKTSGEKNTVKPLLFSLNGAVGAQFNISNQFGLYAEPGVSYFFNDGSDVQTIRKETPFNFNLQAGLRFSY